MDLLFFIGVLLLLITVGISKQSRSESAYLFADRKTGPLALTATLVMTEFNSATLISFSSLGYAVGFRALLLPFVFLIGLLFYAVTVAKKWKTYDGQSVAGFFTERYGKKIGIGTSLLLMVAMLGFSAVYIKSLTLLFHPLLPQLSVWALSALLISVVLVMSLRGGLVAIIRTDLLSLILMLLFFPLTALFMWKSSTLPPLHFLHLSGEILPLRFLFSLLILTLFTYILAPWYGQKIFAAESGKVAYRSVIMAALLIFFLYGSAILATALLRYRGVEVPSWEQALPHLIHTCLPKGVRGAAYALLFATSATTLTGLWSALSAMWIGDFLKTSAESAQRSVRVTLGFALIAYCLANTVVDKVFDKMILANIPIAALAFALLAGFYWKRATPLSAYVSITVGSLCGVGAYLYFGEAGGYTWYWAVYGIPLTFVSGILCCIKVRLPRTLSSQ
ncbi:MAG: hypothetical protein S4CHLAM2_00660 [Chlamydiales bacterium]|nr:hypothetical protein [Chlamydiales bacterium]